MPHPSNKTFNDLPLYVMDVNGDLTDETGVEAVALVDKPAIQRGFLAFQHAEPRMQFAITAEDRRIVSGPLMLADTPIYRRGPKGEEFYVMFPAPVIETIARKFFRQAFQGNVNEMHDEQKSVNGCVMYESFISDESRGIPAMRGYEDTPQGSWFGSFAVENEEIWNRIKAGDFTGFSVEGIFSREGPDEAPADEEPFWSAWCANEQERCEMQALWDILKESE